MPQARSLLNKAPNDVAASCCYPQPGLGDANVDLRGAVGLNPPASLLRKNLLEMSV